jgi:hypothetical protein
MYLTDASRFLISCVIQHYAPVVPIGPIFKELQNFLTKIVNKFSKI